MSSQDSRLAVEVVVVAVLEGGAAAAAAGRRIPGIPGGPALAVREAEVGAEASALLQRLREHLVLLDVLVGDGAARELHRLLEVPLGHLGDLVLLVDVHVAALQQR